MTSQSETPREHARIIQGGMGVGVSGWELAGAVAAAGQIGVVSGTALELVYARQLQNGDPDGHVRRVFERFPIPSFVEQVLDRYFVAGGLDRQASSRSVPMYTTTPSAELQALSVLTNFAEVTLAKERAAGGPIGINYLYKIQLPLLASLYGAMLAGVDYVIIGAGNPAAIPRALNRLARGEDASLPLKVQYAAPSRQEEVHFSPRDLLGAALPSALPRPDFLAIVSSVAQAEALAKDESLAPDGFVFEVASAGGHNAPPRGPARLSAEGEPRYGPLDALDVDALAGLAQPFWLAGSFGSPEGLRRALALGAAGVQVGTAFAFCRESRLSSRLKEGVIRQVRDGAVRVLTDGRASPTGFPFKVVALSETLSEPAAYAARPRVCDLGFLRVPYISAGGTLGYRCPAEPVRVHLAKRGRADQTVGRKCLCNALLANIGLGQRRRGGATEQPLVTAGDDLVQLGRFLPETGHAYGVGDVLDELLGSTCARSAA